MRILHVLDHSLPLHSGYVFRTLGILRAQRDMGWEPVCLTTPRHEAAGGGAQTEDHAGFQFHRTPGAGGGFVGEMRATRRRILELAADVDVIHAHSPALNGLPAVQAGRRLRKPVVYEIRAFWEDAAVDAGRAGEWGAKYRLTRWLETRAARAADHVATICGGLRRDLLDRGLAAGKLSVVPNACDLERHPPISQRDAALAAELGLGEGPVVGFVGSFYPYEGLDLLIDAFPAVRAAAPGAQLMFVGGGPEEDMLRRRAAALPSADAAAVRFIGRVPNDQVRRYYSLFDLLAYPRKSKRITELVTPLKPLEAMALTRNFIASSVGGHRELIRDGETGVLFAPDDPEALAQAAVSVLTEPEAQRAARRAAGRQFVEQERSWRAVAEHYRAIYAAAVASSKTPPVRPVPSQSRADLFHSTSP